MIKGAVDEIFKEIEKLNKELADMQAACKHKKSTPKMFSYGAGRLSPVLVCEDCRDTVTGITDEQIEEVWKQFNALSSGGSCVKV